MKPQLYQAFASYNSKMNKKLFEAADRLSETDRTGDKGAFFKSVQNTLQHNMVADIIWLSRFAKMPNFEILNDGLKNIPGHQTFIEALHPNFQELYAIRLKLDDLIQKFTEALSEVNLMSVLKYANLKGQSFEGELWIYVSHLFNHQTHHRGQATTLLTQHGVDVGVTDFPFVLKEL